MILGLGTDVVDIQRIAEVEQGQQAERFIKRVLSASEQAEYALRKSASSERGLRFLATRFAVKEAFSKAMGCGVGAAFSFQDLSVLNDEAGRPYPSYSERLQAWMTERSAVAHLSMSDERGVCFSTVILSVVK